MFNLLDLVQPHIRIITNIGVAHMTTFKNGIIGYQKEKLKYVQNLPKNTVLIINNDDEILHNFNYQNDIKIIRCGISNKNDLYIMDYQEKTSESFTRIKSNLSGKVYQSKFNNALGKHLATNFCLAIACLDFLNINTKNHILSVYEDRGCIFKNNNILLFDYTYNSSPTSIVNLESFETNRFTDTKIIILGDIYIDDLKYYDILIPYYQKILNKSQKITSNIFIFSNMFFRKIILENKLDFHVFENHQELINNIVSFINEKLKLTEKLSIYIQGCHDSHMSIISNFLRNRYKLF